MGNRELIGEAWPPSDPQIQVFMDAWENMETQMQKTARKVAAGKWIRLVDRIGSSDVILSIDVLHDGAGGTENKFVHGILYPDHPMNPPLVLPPIVSCDVLNALRSTHRIALGQRMVRNWAIATLHERGSNDNEEDEDNQWWEVGRQAPDWSPSHILSDDDEAGRSEPSISGALADDRSIRNLLTTEHQIETLFHDFVQGRLHPEDFVDFTNWHRNIDWR